MFSWEQEQDDDHPMNVSAWRRLALLLLVFGSGCLPLTAGAACKRVEPDRLWNYEGTIDGQHRVRMTLVFGADQIDGVYFYASQLHDIPLRGRISDDRRIVLDELDGAGNVTVRFDGTFPERDPGTRYGDSPLECEVIAGTWHHAGDAKGTALPVYLYLESITAGSLQNRYAVIGVADDEVVHRNAQAFWQAVKAGDRKAATSLICFPIDVQVDGLRKRLGSAADMLAVYDKVFTPAFRVAIAEGLPRNMFVRHDGAMLGSGQVWFGASGKVIALNN